MIRAVSFDAHGTLILPTPSVGELYASRARRHGIERDPEQIQQRFVPAFKAVAANAAVPYGRDEADARRFWHAVIDATFEGAPHALRDDLFEHFGRGSCWRLLPGVSEALALCRTAALPVVVCSNFDGRLHRILADLGLGDLPVYTSAAVGAAKPDPAIIATACRDLGLPPSDLLHIGDNPREDGGACAAIGCRYLPVERGAGIDCDALRAALDG